MPSSVVITPMAMSMRYAVWCDSCSCWSRPTFTAMPSTLQTAFGPRRPVCHRSSTLPVLTRTLEESSPEHYKPGGPLGKTSWLATAAVTRPLRLLGGG